MSKKYRFELGDDLLCMYGPMLYEAKCLKRRESSNGIVQYFIEYKDCNFKKEWIDDNYLLPVNSENLTKLRSLQDDISTKPKEKSKQEIGSASSKNTNACCSLNTIKKEQLALSAITQLKKKHLKKLDICAQLNELVIKPKFSNPKQIVTRGCTTITIDPNAERSKTKDVILRTINLLEAGKASNNDYKISKEKCQLSLRTLALDEIILPEEEAMELELALINYVNDMVLSLPETANLPVINLPDKLQKRQAYDFTMVNTCEKLPKFPDKYTVEHLIYSYMKSKNLRVRPHLREKSFCIGFCIIQYFNLFIDNRLMFTREYISDVHKKGQEILDEKLRTGKIRKTRFSKRLFPHRAFHHVYSPAFLLRLISFLPKVFYICQFERDHINHLIENINDFLEYMESKYDTYFSGDDYE